MSSVVAGLFILDFTPPLIEVTHDIQQTWISPDSMPIALRTGAIKMDVLKTPELCEDYIRSHTTLVNKGVNLQCRYTLAVVTMEAPI